MCAEITNETDELQRRIMIRSIQHCARYLEKIYTSPSYADDVDNGDKSNTQVPTTNMTTRGKKRTSTEALEDHDSDDDETDEAGLSTLGAKNLTEQPDRQKPSDISSEVTRRSKPSVNLALTEEVDIDALVAVRDAFSRDVRAIEVTMMKNRKSQPNQKFSEVHVAEITHLFFGEMIGSAGLSRLRSIISVYNDCPPGEMDRGLGARAEKLAMAEDFTPLSIRRFFGVMSRLDAKKVNTNTHLSQLHQIRSNLDLGDKFLILRTAVDQGDKVMLKFLRDKNYNTSRGVTWVTCVVRYLSEALEVKNDKLWNLIQASLGIRELVNEFGEGILPLIPSTAPNK